MKTFGWSELWRKNCFMIFRWVVCFDMQILLKFIQVRKLFCSFVVEEDLVFLLVRNCLAVTYVTILHHAYLVSLFLSTIFCFTILPVCLNLALSWASVCTCDVVHWNCGIKYYWHRYFVQIIAQRLLESKHGTPHLYLSKGNNLTLYFSIKPSIPEDWKLSDE